MSYSPRGETVDLNGAVFDLAVERLVGRTLLEARQRYQVLFDEKHGAATAQARASAREYRQLAQEFGRRVGFCQRRLERGDAEGVDYRAEIRDALLNAQRYDAMAEAEEKKAIVPKAKQDELWQKAMNGVTGELGSRILKKKAVETEVTTVYQDLLSQISRNLDDATRRIAIEAHRPYLDASRASMEEALRGMFGDHVYVGEAIPEHVDGTLDHMNSAVIFTSSPEDTKKRLKPEIEIPEGTLCLVSSSIIPLNDNTGESIVEARYRGSRKLHD